MTGKQVAKAKEFKLDIIEVQNMVKEYQILTLVPDDSKSYKVCRTALTACVRVRTGIDKRRLELNSDDQEKIKARNLAAKELASLIAPAEEHLSGLVKGEDARKAAIEAEKEAVEKAKVQGWIDDLLKIGIVLDHFTVATMSDEDFNTFYATSRTNYEAEQARIAEDARIEAEKKEAYRIAQEKKEAELKAEAERQEAVRKEQEAKTAELKAEEQRIEWAIRVEKAREQGRKDREAFEKQLAEEVRAKAEKEAQEEAEWKAEQEKQAKLEAERQLALRPDKEKLQSFAQFLQEGIEYPDLTSDEAKAILRNAIKQIYDIGEETLTAIERL